MLVVAVTQEPVGGHPLIIYPSCPTKDRWGLKPIQIVTGKDRIHSRWVIPELNKASTMGYVTKAGLTLTFQSHSQMIEKVNVQIKT